MTQEELHEFIRATVLANPTLKALIEQGSDYDVAELIRPMLPKVPKPDTHMGERSVFVVLGMEDAEIFLQTVEGISVSPSPQASIFARAVRWLRDPVGIDLGSEQVQSMLLQMKANQVIKASIVDKLIEHGSQPYPLTFNDISDAVRIWRTDGMVGPIPV